MREGLGFVENQYTFVGITPAYAGRTDLEDLKTRGREDHPRLCGKDGILVGSKVAGAGSPPLMREGLLECLSYCV